MHTLRILTLFIGAGITLLSATEAAFSTTWHTSEISILPNSGTPRALAVGRNSIDGSVEYYLAYAVTDGSGTNIKFSESNDGSTWSSPEQIAQVELLLGGAISIAVDGDGAVGIAYATYSVDTLVPTTVNHYVHYSYRPTMASNWNAPTTIYSDSFNPVCGSPLSDHGIGSTVIHFDSNGKPHVTAILHYGSQSGTLCQKNFEILYSFDEAFATSVVDMAGNVAIRPDTSYFAMNGDVPGAISFTTGIGVQSPHKVYFLEYTSSGWGSPQLVREENDVLGKAHVGFIEGIPYVVFEEDGDIHLMTRSGSSWDFEETLEDVSIGTSVSHVIVDEQRFRIAILLNTSKLIEFCTDFGDVSTQCSPISGDWVDLGQLVAGGVNSLQIAIAKDPRSSDNVYLFRRSSTGTSVLTHRKDRVRLTFVGCDPYPQCSGQSFDMEELVFTLSKAPNPIPVYEPDSISGNTFTYDFMTGGCYVYRAQVITDIDGQSVVLYDSGAEGFSLNDCDALQEITINMNKIDPSKEGCSGPAEVEALLWYSFLILALPMMLSLVTIAAYNIVRFRLRAE